MTVGVVLAALMAICSGSAAILQSVGAARIARFSTVDPRLLLALVRNRAYLAGLALNGTSFGLSVAALRTTPLFVVQGIGAANLAVVALLGVTILRHRLPRLEWTGVAAVVAGVVLLAVAGRAGPAVNVALTGHWALLAAALALAGLGFAARGLRGAVFPGLLAGLAFASAAVASRLIGGSGSGLAALVLSPLPYAIVLGGLMGTLLYATALQRGSVTSASTLATVGQALVPALVGWLVLGDRFGAGLGVAAVVGFSLALVGAAMLARHGAPHAARRADPADTTLAPSGEPGARPRYAGSLP